jgi:hypothetical protein
VNTDALLAELSTKRWFGARDRQPTALKIVERTTISKVPPQLEIVLATIEFAGGGKRLYQLLLVGGEGEAISWPTVRASRAGAASFTSPAPD